MKKLITLLLLAATVSLANAQQPDSTRNATNKAETEDTIICTDEETPAQFPGGEEALYAFLFNNLIYPQKAKNYDHQGKVIVAFDVEKDGSLSNIRVKRSVSRELDAEAVRVVSIMPKWKPATLKGEIVRSLYRLPIHFALQL